LPEMRWHVTARDCKGQRYWRYPLDESHIAAGNYSDMMDLIEQFPTMLEQAKREALEEYTARVGFFSIDLPNTILEGIGFEYAFDENGGRWQGLCVDGLGETAVDLGVLVAADTWYDLDLEVNADGDSVEFFIDGVSKGTVAANIPSGSTFNLFYNFMIMKLAGTTSRSFAIDHYYIYQEVSR
ncbi:hypothetical protein LCGC14_2032320, partial [marine sediment metagenome]